MSVSAPVQTNLFRPIVSKKMVERAVIASLEQWMDTYLGQIERIEYLPDGSRTYAGGQVERPRGIISRSEFDKWPEDQLPVILVLCSGLAGQPERYARGNYRAAWTVGVAALVSDVDEDSTEQLASAYGSAIRTAILQHKTLKSSLYPAGFANGVRWEDESYSDAPTIQGRTQQAARVIFSIAVDDVVTEYAGPREPLPDPTVDPGDWPVVENALANVTPIGFEASS